MPQTHDDEHDTGKLDFSSLILGFSSAALYELGQAQLDNHKLSEPNFDLAEQNIDIIRMLKEKTIGNLTGSEEKLLNNVIKDLESKYQETLKGD